MAVRASSRTDVLAALESVLDAEARSHRRDPPVHPRGRSVAESRPRRAVRRPAARARARRRPSRAHAGAHLPSGRTLRRRVASRTRTPSRPTRRISRAIAVAGNMMYEVGYYPHNIHFFVTSASMEGRRADALKAADEVRARMHADMLRDPAMGGMVQHMHLTPLFTKVRFATVGARCSPSRRRPRICRTCARCGTRRAAWRTRPRPARRGREGARGRGGTQGRSVAEDARRVGREHRVDVVAIAHEVLAGELAAKRRRAD